MLSIALCQLYFTLYQLIIAFCRVGMLLLVGGESVGLSMGLTCRVLGLHDSVGLSMGLTCRVLGLDMHHIYPKMPA